MQIYDVEIENEKIEKINKLINEIFPIDLRRTDSHHTVDYDKLNQFGQILKQEIENLYFKKGIGFKLLGKILNNKGASYTQLRKIFQYLKIKRRKGQNIITDNLKELRKINATKIARFKNWPEERPELLKNLERSLNGWYFNKSKNKYVYLRSTWEYAYAKYLDKKGAIWDMEVRSYLLKSGKHYLPDFFIFDKHDKLINIVEIKSMYNYDADKRLQKYFDFVEEYPTIKAELITDPKILFNEILQEGYHKIVSEWKKIRKIREDS